ncbi:hypothetical protein V8C42DRAFT_64196 [Trichoderma barbatum]
MIMKLLAGSPRQILHAAITRTAYKITSYTLFTPGQERGALEPEESFLRSSKILYQQQLREDQAEPFPLMRENHLQTSDEGCVLITAKWEGKDSSGSQGASLCAYLTYGSPDATDKEDLAAILKREI